MNPSRLVHIPPSGGLMNEGPWVRGTGSVTITDTASGSVGPNDAGGWLLWTDAAVMTPSGTGTATLTVTPSGMYFIQWLTDGTITFTGSGSDTPATILMHRINPWWEYMWD